MTYETIALVKFTAELTGRNRPVSLAAYAIEYDIDPEVIETMPSTPENVSKAKDWLSGKRTTCERYGNLHEITTYAIEYYLTDADGEFWAGSDYDYAEEEEEVKW